MWVKLGYFIMFWLIWCLKLFWIVNSLRLNSIL